MLIACISDTHNQLEKIPVPHDIDVLVHAGDMLGRGSVAELHDQLQTLVRRFRDVPHIVFIAGNHDWVWQVAPEIAQQVLLRVQENFKGKLHYLQDSGVEIDGVKFWGSPWQPEFFNWAFNLPRNGKELEAVYAKVPSGIDVLITHGPPFRILDKVRDEQVGCEKLLESLQRIKPKVHVFGHIHCSRGIIRAKNAGETTFVNASNLDDDYRYQAPPILVEVEAEKSVNVDTFE